MSGHHLTLVKDLYQNRSLVYDDSYHPKFASNLFSMAIAPPFQLPPSPLILDLACGTGLVSIPALQSTGPSSRVYGIDLTAGMLEVAQEKKSKLPLEQQDHIQFIQHDVSDLSGVQELAGLEGKFDIITCASAFVLLQHPASAIAEWARWLKPQTGRLVLDATHPHYLRTGTIMKTIAGQLRCSVSYNRKWRTDEAAFKRMVEVGGLFEVERVEFVEQVGVGTRYFDGGRGEAEGRFEGCIGSGAYRELRRDEGMRGEARELFVREWAEAADDKGLVEVVDGVWVVVARKT